MHRLKVGFLILLVVLAVSACDKNPTLTPLDYDSHLWVDAEINEDNIEVVVRRDFISSKDLWESVEILVFCGSDSIRLGKMTGWIKGGAEMSLVVPIATLKERCISGTHKVQLLARYEVWKEMPSSGTKLFEGDKSIDIDGIEGYRNGDGVWK